jgi:Protein of unknown function (DUF3078)
MKRIEFLTVMVISCLIIFGKDGFSQERIINKEVVRSIVDSLGRKGMITKSDQGKPDIKFTGNQALRYLQEKYRPADWNNPEDPLRNAIGELIFIATHQRFDSLSRYLGKYQYDSIDMPWVKFFKWDSLRMKVPVIIPAAFSQRPDTVPRWDTLKVPENHIPDSLKTYLHLKPSSSVIMKDTIFMIATETFPEVPRCSRLQPFRTYRFPYQADSISVAVNTLRALITEGDSSRIYIRGISGSPVAVWLNSKSERMEHYWLKNEFSDSVIVWIGTSGRDTLGLLLEEGIMFRRPVKQTNISNAQLDLKNVNSGALQKINKVVIKPRIWKLHSETNFVLNQTYLTNWVSGGQSNVSTTLDATGFADYRNDDLGILANNFVRLKYGFIKPGKEDIQKSDDQLETNSKISHKAFGKFNFTAIMLFKTQISKGYDYPNDSIAVSGFMNPATLTLGLGLDYKPLKKTSINFAPISYKATFVLDTVHYDETKYGLQKNKRVLQEFGASLQITNEFSPVKSIIITNRLQLFTNYINNPQNIVVDWEMIATAKLNWFTDVRFNTHMVYDDKVLIPLVDDNGKPILGPDGVQKKGKRLQFKELLGLSFVFRL